MTNSHNHIGNDLKPHSNPNKPTDGPVKTFIDAQLAYAKSKHGKQAKRNKQYYPKKYRNKRGVK